MEGTPDEVKTLVAHRVRQLGSEGEYICAPDQYMPYPPENLAAWKQAVEELR